MYVLENSKLETHIDSSFTIKSDYYIAYHLCIFNEYWHRSDHCVIHIIPMHRICSRFLDILEMSSVICIQLVAAYSASSLIRQFRLYNHSYTYRLCYFETISLVAYFKLLFVNFSGILWHNRPFHIVYHHNVTHRFFLFNIPFVPFCVIFVHFG